jgi:hypothetical protein
MVFKLNAISHLINCELTTFLLANFYYQIKHFILPSSFFKAVNLITKALFSEASFNENSGFQLCFRDFRIETLPNPLLGVFSRLFL